MFTLVATAATASADEPSQGESPEIEPAMLAVPTRCEAFVPNATAKDAQFWNQWLTLAACVQDIPDVTIRSSAEVSPMLERVSEGLVLALLLYDKAIEHAPPDVKLRAVFHINLASQSLITRARAALTGAPRSPGFRTMQAELEEQLVPVKHLVWLTCSIIDRQVSDLPTLIDDPIARNMIRAARATLRSFPEVPVVARRSATLLRTFE